MFRVKFEGNLMFGALNQLVGSRQWIPAIRTLILSFLALVFFHFRYFGIIKRVRSYPFLVSFFQIDELSLSLGVLGPYYTLEIMLSPRLRFLTKSH